MRASIPIIGPSYPSRKAPISIQSTVNLFPQVDQQGKEIVSLNPFPGLTEFADLVADAEGLFDSGSVELQDLAGEVLNSGAVEGGVDRGGHVMAGVQYQVSGPSLYSINVSGVASFLGTLHTPTRCVFADNGTQLIIATGGAPYVYTVAGGLVEITDADLANDPKSVAYLNSRFIYDQSDGTFMVSNLLDGTAIDALDIATAEARPDDLLRVFTHRELLYLCGEETIEVWYNTGTSRPPFQKQQVITKGIASTYAIDAIDDVIYLLDNLRDPRMIQGQYEHQEFGNPAIGSAWAGYSTVSDAIVEAFHLDQQHFVAYIFPTAGKTWVYQVNSNAWFELQSSSARHRVSTYIRAYGKLLGTDHTNGKVYTLDFDSNTDDGTAITRTRDSAILHGGLFGSPGEKMRMRDFRLDIETDGTSTVTVSKSDDLSTFTSMGTFTLTANDRIRLTGASGVTTPFHERVLRVQTTAGATILAASAELEPVGGF